MKSMMHRRAFLVACAALAAGPAAAAETASVTIDAFAFTPAVLKVKAGTEIAFVNHDRVAHSVVAADGSFRSRPLDTGQSYAMTARRPGEIAYFCGLHPRMKAKIIVVP